MDLAIWVYEQILYVWTVVAKSTKTLQRLSHSFGLKAQCHVENNISSRLQKL